MERVAEIHNLDAHTTVSKFRSLRTRDAILQLVPSAELLAEVQRLEAIELSELAAVHPLPGAAAMLAMLLPSQWAVVTSGSRRLAQARLKACGLPVPDVVISIEDVSRLKPDPEGFIAAAIRLNVDPADCIVFEDSPDGVQAGRHSGCTVIALTTTHQPAVLDRADGLVKDLGSGASAARTAGSTSASRVPPDPACAGDPGRVRPLVSRPSDNLFAKVRLTNQ